MTIDKPPYALRQRVVYKYPLNQGYEEISVPVGSILRHVAVVKGQPTLWIEQTPDLGKETWHLCVVGTGHTFSEVYDMEHVGSGHCVETSLVWHVYRFHEPTSSDPSSSDTK